MAEDREIIEEVSPVSVLPDVQDDEDSPRSSTGDRYKFLTTTRRSDIIPPYWSPQRDEALKRLARSNDYFSVAIFNAIMRFSPILPNVNALDNGDDVGMETATISQMLLQRNWIKIAQACLQDVNTTDNGMFIEVLGGGSNPDGPLEPIQIPDTNIILPATGLKHLDSTKCTRTGHDEFPVRYRHSDGKEYKLHHTRVIFESQLPSTDSEMNGVGFCAVSRLLSTLLQSTESERILTDMLYDGMVGEIVMAYGLSLENMHDAYQAATTQVVDPTLPRFRKSFYLEMDTDDWRIERHPLRRLPEGWDKEEDVTRVMYLLAGAIGVDPRELWPSVRVGQTKSDAELQHAKARLKLGKWWCETMTAALNEKFVPVNACVEFELQDEYEKSQSRDSRQQLSTIHGTEIDSGVITVDVAREQMMNEGYITEAQFNQLQISNPALSDATREDVQGLFGQRASTKTIFRILKHINPLTVIKVFEDVDTIDEYADALDDLVDQLDKGTISEQEFGDLLDELIIAASVAAFLLGSEKQPSQLTDTDVDYLANQVDIHRNVIDDFAANIAGEGSHLGRVGLWQNMYGTVREGAKLFTVGDPRLTWRRGATEQGCDTCNRWDGVTRLASEWRREGLAPRAKNGTLDCGGWRCECELLHA